MNSAISIANYFIKKGIESKSPVTQMKLQKLLYFSYGWYLAYYTERAFKRLFNERIEAWKFGPVVSDVYHSAKQWGNDGIISSLKTDKYDNKTHQWKFDVSPKIKENRSTEEKRNFLDEIWEIYSPYGAFELSNATHAHGSPWKRVIEDNKGLLYSHMPIPDEYILEHFKKYLKKENIDHNSGIPQP